MLNPYAHHVDIGHPIQGTAQTFAQYAQGNAHIIVCGRNEAAALETIASFPEGADAKYEFLECDVSRLANVTAACKRLKEERGLTKLNYIVMRYVFFSSLSLSLSSTDPDSF